METALTLAADQGDLVRVEQLLRSGVDPNEPNSHGESPMMVAAAINNVQVLALLLQFGADVNRAYHQGFTALHMAVDSSIDSTIQSGGLPGDEPTEAIIWLLEHGADASRKTEDGHTALDIAALYRAESVRTLLRKYIG